MKNARRHVILRRSNTRRSKVVNRIWALPALLVVAGVVASLGLSEIDKAAGYDLVPKSVVGTASTAQQVLSLIASAVLNLATVVLSLTLVAVQLAMGQFSRALPGHVRVQIGRAHV